MTEYSKLRDRLTVLWFKYKVSKLEHKKEASIYKANAEKIAIKLGRI